MKIYVFIVTLFLTCLLFQISFAKTGNEWFNGEIELTSGEVLSGQLNHTDGIVQCKFNNRIKAFSTLQVSHFQFYDPSLDKNRIFVPVDNSVVDNTKEPAFYELVSDGVITLLRKEVYTYKLVNDAFKDRDLAWETRTIQRNQHDVHMRVQDFEYYYIYKENLHGLKNFRKEISPLMKAHETDIAHFIEKNALNTREQESQIKIIDYFNQLCQENNMALFRQQ